MIHTWRTMIEHVEELIDNLPAFARYMLMMTCIGLGAMGVGLLVVGAVVFAYL